VKPRMAQNT
jgi:hypothetical protein